MQYLVGFRKIISETLRNVRSWPKTDSHSMMLAIVRNMFKVILFMCLLFSTNAIAGGGIVCPDGSRAVCGPGEHEGKVSKVFTCSNGKGEPHGPSIITVDGVIVDKCNYNNGIEDGTCMRWYLTGEKQFSMQFRNGLLDGETKGWYKNGATEMQSFYNAGEPVGKWKKWNDKGELIKVINH